VESVSYIKSVKPEDGKIRVDLERGDGRTPATAITDHIQWWTMDGEFIRKEVH